MSEIKKISKRNFIHSTWKISGLLITLLVTAVLARKLSPNDFGVVAIATFFINFFSSISTSGFSPAIIQNRTLNETDYQNIYA